MGLLLDFFVHYLFSKRAGAVVKKIAWLSFAGLLFSVTCLVVVISVMNALNRHAEDRMMSVQPHLLIEVPDISDTNLLAAHPLVAKLRANADLRVHVGEVQDLILRTFEGKFQGAEARGMSLDNLNERLHEIDKLKDNPDSGMARDTQWVSAENAPKMDLLLTGGEVVMGADLASTLGVYEGDTVMAMPPESLILPIGEVPRFERLLVKKILMTNIADVDAQNLFYEQGDTLRNMHKSLSLKRVIEVWNKKSKNVDDLKAEIESNYPGVKVQTWKELDSALFMALRLEKMIIGTFLSLSGLIASFSLISLVVLLISQKRREIGLLMSLGFSKKKIRTLFFSLGASLGLVAILAGTGLGSAISFYIEKNPLHVLDPEVYYDSTIPAYLDFKFVFFVSFIGIAICSIGAALAASQAGQDAPAVSLRQK